MKLLIIYPHLPATRVFIDGFDEVWFGSSMLDGAQDERVIYTATCHATPLPGRDLLCLEPPIVEPHAYDADYRAGFRKVFSFAGPDTGNVIHFRHGIPPLWPTLPHVVDRFPWEARLKAVVAVMGDKYADRRQEVVEMARHVESKGLEFHLFGRPAWDLPWYRGEAHDKRGLLRRYRYCYCPENSALSCYMTEKLPEALFAGCFPIYPKGASPTEYPTIPWNWIWGPKPTLNECEKTHRELLDLVDERSEGIRKILDTENLWRLLLKESR